MGNEISAINFVNFPLPKPTLKWPKCNYWTIGVLHIYVLLYSFCPDIDIDI